jgi:hypothetical protein
VPQGPPDQPPDSIVLGQFKGMKNTVSRERLGPDELEKAINVDIDAAGQVRRRRGYTKVLTGSWHSTATFTLKVLGVRDGMLGEIIDGYSFNSLGVFVGSQPLACTEVNGEIYFCNNAVSGVIATDNTISPWGKTDGQGLWLSPVLDDTDTLGKVSGELLGDPMRASCIAAHKGRIYLADGKTLWRTELYRYHFVNRTKGFYQFEYDITLVMSTGGDGIFVGTTGGLYFLAEERILMREFGSLKLNSITGDAVLPGSGQLVPAELIHPQARQTPFPMDAAAVFMTTAGIVAGFSDGSCYNITLGAMVFPAGVSAAALFRQDSGDNHFVVAVDSEGGPAANARIGDYVDAQIIRASQVGG